MQLVQRLPHVQYGGRWPLVVRVDKLGGRYTVLSFEQRLQSRCCSLRSSGFLVHRASALFHVEEDKVSGDPGDQCCISALRAVVFVLPSRTQPPKTGRGRMFAATWVRGSVFAGSQTTSKAGKNQSIDVLRLR